jgi:hypothetical protein
MILGMGVDEAHRNGFLISFYKNWCWGEPEDKCFVLTTAKAALSNSLSGRRPTGTCECVTTRGFEGPLTQNIRQPIGFAALKGAQAEAFTANTTTVDLLLSHCNKYLSHPRSTRIIEIQSKKLKILMNNNKILKIKLPLLKS